MAKFRSKPKEIDAVKCLNREFADDALVFDEVPQWLQDAIEKKTVTAEFHSEDYWYYRIQTLHGPVLAAPGDWIVRGIEGELYPCSSKIFAATYEPVKG